MLCLEIVSSLMNSGNPISAVFCGLCLAWYYGFGTINVFFLSVHRICQTWYHFGLHLSCIVESICGLYGLQVEKVHLMTLLAQLSTSATWITCLPPMCI